MWPAEFAQLMVDLFGGTSAEVDAFIIVSSVGLWFSTIVAAPVVIIGALIIHFQFKGD